jgi:hypothetical protein
VAIPTKYKSCFYKTFSIAVGDTSGFALFLCYGHSGESYSTRRRFYDNHQQILQVGHDRCSVRNTEKLYLGAEFRAVGRIPLAQGWKAVYGASEPDAAGDETEQTLPPLTDGEMARLTELAPQFRTVR